MKHSIAFPFLLALAALAQPIPPKAPPKPIPPKPAAIKPPSGVDAIIALVKGRMTEPLILKMIQREAKTYDLSAADMLKLQQAGVSERVIETMMNPASAAPAAPVAASPPPEFAPEPTPVASPPVQTAASVTPRAPVKRRLAVMPFDHAAVATWVRYWFHTDYNVGQGIRAMLTARLAKSKSIVLLERARLDAIEKELKLNNTSMVNQGTKAKMGRVSGADCMLLGDIVIFGRDDKTERSRSAGSTLGTLARRMPGIGNRVGTMGQFSKEEKAVVAIALRIVDTETGEVLETAEARGESKRSSKNWDAFVYGNGQARSESSEMTSSNFEATIIGEATSNAVDQVVQFLEDRIPRMQSRSRTVEGRVAKIAGNSVILGIGSSDGVQAGDRFEIHKIIDEVIDPGTKEVLDVQTAKVGELVVDNPREKIATGVYTGQPLSATWAKGYTARLVVQ
ncbi:MAG: CsgG/HfaB family protein [Bryobacteraceae bacterium]